MKITTKYRGATDTAGSIITAITSKDGKRVQRSISYPYELSIIEGHTKAVENLLDEIGVSGEPRLVGNSEKGYEFEV